MGILFQFNEPGIPPASDRVALRARILGVVCWRGYQEIGWREGMEVESDPQGLVLLPAWLFAAQAELEVWEIQCLNMRLGEMPDHCCSLATWQCEGIAVLLWALQLGEKPDFESPVLPMRVLGQLAETAWEQASLRPQAELRRYAENVHSWQARFRQFWAQQEHVDFVDQARRYGMDVDELPIVEGDIGLLGRPLAESASMVLGDNYLAVASERLRAAKWLCGLGSERYSEVEV